MAGSNVLLQIEETVSIVVGPVNGEVVIGGRGHVKLDQLVLRDALPELVPVQVSVPFQLGQSWECESDGDISHTHKPSLLKSWGARDELKLQGANSGRGQEMVERASEEAEEER